MNNKYSADEIIQMDKDNLWHHLTQHKVFQSADPMVIVEADGLRVKDIKGNEYLDFVSGGVWGVVAGYGRQSIVDAVARQLEVMPYFAGTAGTIPTIQFAAKLTSLMPGLGKVYFSNSGSEANEKAFKIIRQIGNIKGKKTKIIYRDRDYHGTTITALSATGQPQRKELYGPLTDGFVSMPHACCYRCPFDKNYPGCGVQCATVLEDIIQKEGADTVGGIILEPITAGGGLIPPVKEYYKIIREICDKYDVYLVIDEVVCCMGRTGEWFGYQHYDFVPDIVTMAKGLANSYQPLSATVMRDSLYEEFLADPSDALGYFRDISTYGGCTGSFAAALETVRIIEDENLVERSKTSGEYFLKKLEALCEYPIVGDARGRGLFAGLEIVTDKDKKTPAGDAMVVGIVGDVLKQSVMVGRTNRSFHDMNNVITFAPSLTATEKEMDTVVDAVEVAIKNACK